MIQMTLALALSISSAKAWAYTQNNFDIGDFKGEGEIVKEFVYVGTTLRFKACLRQVFERSAHKAEMGIKFRISDGHQMMQAETDENGCLSWVEKHYISGAKEAGDAQRVRPFDFPRYIIGDGKLSGMYPLRIGVAFRNGKFLLDQTEIEGGLFRIERRESYFSFDQFIP